MSDEAGKARLGAQAVATITLPTVDPEVAPILYTVPVQLLAYYTAVAKGTDVDQPRNRTKISVSLAAVRARGPVAARPAWRPVGQGAARGRAPDVPAPGPASMSAR